MITQIEKFWPFLSILFIIVIAISMSVWPAGTRLLSVIIMGLSLTAIVTFTIRRQVQAYRDGKISRPVLARNIVVGVTDILMTMVLVVIASILVTGRVAQAAGKVWGTTVGILSTLVMGLVVGLAVSLFVRWVADRIIRLLVHQAWVFITKPRKFITTKIST